jgi:hypothetical protein
MRRLAFPVRAAARTAPALLALSAGLLLAGAALAADPLPDSAAPPTASTAGPIYDGKQHQPTLDQVIERERARGIMPESGPNATSDPLYQSVLKNSEQPLPQRLDDAH